MLQKTLLKLFLALKKIKKDLGPWNTVRTQGWPWFWPTIVWKQIFLNCLVFVKGVGPIWATKTLLTLVETLNATCHTESVFKADILNNIHFGESEILGSSEAITITAFKSLEIIIINHVDQKTSYLSTQTWSGPSFPCNSVIVLFGIGSRVTFDQQLFEFYLRFFPDNICLHKSGFYSMLSNSFSKPATFFKTREAAHFKTGVIFYQAKFRNLKKV